MNKFFAGAKGELGSPHYSCTILCHGEQLHIERVIKVDAHADMPIYLALLLGALQLQISQRGISLSQHGPHTQMGWFEELHRSQAHQNEQYVSFCVRPYL